jgi:plasmid stability protein
MAADGTWDPLLAHLERTTRLDRAEARKVLRETLAYFSEPLPDFVARRHRELRAQSLRNEAIYRVIADEVRERRFAAGPLSERQIRRLVYG